MKIYTLFISLTFSIISIGCIKSQSKDSIHVRKVSNENLLYALSYIDSQNIYRYNGSEYNYFVKCYKLISKKQYHYGHEYRAPREFFYILVSSFDEYTHLEATLYKTEALILPVLINIEESKDENKFMINISHVPEALGKTAKEDTLIHSKNKSYLNFKKSELMKKVSSTITICKK